MFPLLMLPTLFKGLTSMVKSTGSLAEGAANSVSEEAENQQKLAQMVGQNVAETTDTNTNKKDETDEEPKELFGGLDLARVKSVIDDGPAEGSSSIIGGKGVGVYREILAVNKSMASSLLRIEETLKMMLSIEYERIQGMIQQSTSENLEKGNLDPKDPPKKGLFGRAAAGVGGMLGGAYSKAKGGLGGNIGKLLKLGAVVLLFKTFEDDIRKATEGILKYFKGLYDVFDKEGIGAVFNKIGDDIKNVFYPAVKNMVGNMMNMIVTAVKEMIFGASGSKRIAQEVRDASLTKKTLSTLSNKIVAGGGDPSKISVDAKGLTMVEDSSALSKDENKQLQASVIERLNQMHQISEQADGRIQWTTFPNADFGNKWWQFSGKNLDEYFKFYTLPQIIDAMPVIDGVPMTSWDALNDQTLDERAGVTVGDSDSRKKKIYDILAKKTTAFQANKFGEVAELEAQFQAMNPVKFKSYNTSASFDTIGTSVGTDGLRVTGTPRGDGTTFDSKTNTYIDKSVKQNVSAPTNNNVALSGVNTNSTGMILGPHMGLASTTGYGIA